MCLIQYLLEAEILRVDQMIRRSSRIHVGKGSGLRHDTIISCSVCHEAALIRALSWYSTPTSALGVEIGIQHLMMRNSCVIV